MSKNKPTIITEFPMVVSAIKLNKAHAEITNLRRLIDDFMIAWDTGELQCDVPNGRFWKVLKEFKEISDAGHVGKS